MAATLPIGATSRARSAVHGTLRKPFTHACKLLGPPSLNTRAHTAAEPSYGDTGRDAPLGPGTPAGLGGPAPCTELPSQPRGRRAPPGTRAARGRRRRRLRAPEALREPGGRRGQAQRGAGMGRGGGRAERGRPEGTAAQGRGEEGCGRRAAVTDPARRDGARFRPAALTHLPRTRRRSWLLSARFPRRRLPGDVTATAATAGPGKR